MAKRFDPRSLFEPVQQARAASDDGDLDAVASGRRGMAMFISSVDEVADWIALASRRRLLVTLHGDGDQLHVFVARPEELWRVPAYLALWDTAFVDGRWSDASENLASHLLGYSKQQRKAWLAAHREEFPAWTAATVYAVLDGARREAVESVAYRSFGPTASLEGLSLFLQRGRIAKKGALSKVPRGHTLARAGLRLEDARRLFGAEAELRVTKRIAPKLGAALLTNIQFLTRSGWR